MKPPRRRERRPAAARHGIRVAVPLGRGPISTLADFRGRLIEHEMEARALGAYLAGPIAAREVTVDALVTRSLAAEAAGEHDRVEMLDQAENAASDALNALREVHEALDESRGMLSGALVDLNRVWPKL